MLLWQHKSVRDRAIEWGPSITVACTVHLAFLCWFLFCGQGSAIEMVLSGSRRARPQTARVGLMVCPVEPVKEQSVAKPAQAAPVKKPTASVTQKKVTAAQPESKPLVPEKKEVVDMTVNGTPAPLGADQRYAQLQEALASHWTPPVGIDAETACQVRAIVDVHGRTTEVTIARPSGVLVYDIAARAAILAATLPRWARGNTILITFTQ